MNFKEIEKNRINSNGFCCLALIDPDIKNENKLDQILSNINNSNFSGILVGGSLIMDDKFDVRVKYIYENTDLPVFIFPGSSNQVTTHCDFLLYLTLLSGRNPEYLISEHVRSAPRIYNSDIKTISTGYILLESNKRTSVEIISDTLPLPMDKHDIILAHALAGQYLGNSLMYLDCGSGSDITVQPKLVHYLNKHLSIPIMVGGGITTPSHVKEISNSGAAYIVIGSLLENLDNANLINEMTSAI